jgi:hypothetical protein
MRGRLSGLVRRVCRPRPPRLGKPRQEASSSQANPDKRASPCGDGSSVTRMIFSGAGFLEEPAGRANICARFVLGDAPDV